MYWPDIVLSEVDVDSECLDLLLDDRDVGSIFRRMAQKDSKALRRNLLRKRWLPGTGAKGRSRVGLGVEADHRRDCIARVRQSSGP